MTLNNPVLFRLDEVLSPKSGSIVLRYFSYCTRPIEFQYNQVAVETQCIFFTFIKK